MCKCKETQPTSKPVYTTVEGHEIVRDGVYENRIGQKVVVLGFNSSRNKTSIPIIGYTEEYLDQIGAWGVNGYYHYTKCNQQNNDRDIMRPWVDKKPTDIIETGTYAVQRNGCKLEFKDKTIKGVHVDQEC